jgi:hypothetical protein
LIGLLTLLALVVLILVGVVRSLGLSPAECVDKIIRIISNNSETEIRDDGAPKAALVRKTKGILVSSGRDVRGENEGDIDFSEKDKGFFFVRYSGDLPNVRIQVKGDSGIKNHIYAPNKKWQGFPVCGKPGRYEICIAANDGSSVVYNLIFAASEMFDFDEKAPFLYSNAYVSFRADSPLTEKARSLVKGTGNNQAAVERILRWVKQHVTYDYEKARRAVDGTMTPQEGLSDPDRIFAKGNGICSDLAVLSAAMLRSVGLPTKMVYGKEIRHDESEKESYHAWIYVHLGGKWVMYDPGYGPKAIIAHQLPGKSTYFTPDEVH